MSTPAVGHNRPVWKGFHPFVYKAMIGLAIWLVLSIWWGFAAGGETDFLLGVVSVFIFISVVLPLIAARTWRRRRRPEAERESESFHDWESGDFDTNAGRLSGKEAAAQALLPIAAVAFGMTVFALVAHFAA